MYGSIPGKESRHYADQADVLGPLRDGQAAPALVAHVGLKRKLMSLSHGQELGQLADMAL